MPIRLENRDRYPADWPEISKRIREERARGRCECRGECEKDHRAEREINEEHIEALHEFYGDMGLPVPPGFDPPQDIDTTRCAAVNRLPHPVTGSRVVLTVAHLDHTPEHCDDDNLRAMCQRCHLNYDRPRHAVNARENRRRRRALGDLFGGPTEAELAAAKAATGLMRARK